MDHLSPPYDTASSGQIQTSRGPWSCDFGRKLNAVHPKISDRYQGKAKYDDKVMGDSHSLVREFERVSSVSI